MKNYEATINGKRVMATATGARQVHIAKGRPNYIQPVVEFYPEGGRGYTMLLKDVDCSDGDSAESVAGDVLVGMGFTPITEGWEQRA